MKGVALLLVVVFLVATAQGSKICLTGINIAHPFGFHKILWLQCNNVKYRIDGIKGHGSYTTSPICLGFAPLDCKISVVVKGKKVAVSIFRIFKKKDKTLDIRYSFNKGISVKVKTYVKHSLCKKVLKFTVKKE